MECGDFFRKDVSRLSPQPANPDTKDGDGRLTQSPDLRIAERLGLLERGETRRMQNLVRVGVANAAEETRIGQGAFDGVRLPRQSLAKRVKRRIERFDAPRVERLTGLERSLSESPAVR